MSIKHHLTDETLCEYAAGTLTEAFEVVIACHLTLCPACRHKASIKDQVGGYFLMNADSEPPTISAQQSLAQINQQRSNSPQGNLTSLRAGELPHQQTIGQGQRQASALTNTTIMNGAQDLTKLPIDVPRALARRLPSDIDDLPWKSLAPGVRQFNLGDTPKGEGAFKLLKLEPGVELLDHSHGDQELTLVLRGAYTDSIGQFGVGDVADLGADHSHKPVISSDEPCIALIASKSPAQYHSLIGKIMQPFIGI